MRKKRLGDLLRDSGLITEDDLKMVLEVQKQTGKRMGEVLSDQGLVSDFDIARLLSGQLGIQHVALESTPIEPEAIDLLPESLARKYRCIPICFDRKYLTVAMADPLDYEAIRDIGFHSSLETRPLISTQREILEAIEHYYKLADSVDSIIKQTADMAKGAYLEILPVLSSSDVTPAADLIKKSQLAPIVKLLNLILMKAIKARASDIHVESQRTSISVRIRVDGVLREEMSLPKWVHGALVSRIKIIASLDITERRLPQDGSTRIRFNHRDIDLRISTIPAHFGEKVVIRILDQSNVTVRLEELGFSDHDLKQIVEFSQRRKGIFLVTGPTGSGKTTTLYAIINKIRSGEINIMTVEDPIEYNVEGISQIQINPDIGLTFANCLRSILRQDPNVILIGEIRDLETAEIAFRAAMTGHLVISTVHTNDSISTISRLIDIGIPRYLISSSVIGVVAQRLVRKICPKCKIHPSPSRRKVPNGQEEGEPGEEMNRYIGKGCKSCNFTGFQGRTGIFEILRLTPKIRDMIASGSTEEEIRSAVRSQRVSALGEDGAMKVKEGITTLEEVLRVVELERDVRALCRRCDRPIQLDFIACPYCKFEVQKSCRSCTKPLQSGWIMCPYCGNELEPSGVPSPI